MGFDLFSRDIDGANQIVSHKKMVSLLNNECPDNASGLSNKASFPNL